MRQRCLEPESKDPLSGTEQNPSRVDYGPCKKRAVHGWPRVQPVVQDVVNEKPAPDRAAEATHYGNMKPLRPLRGGTFPVIQTTGSVPARRDFTRGNKPRTPSGPRWNRRFCHGPILTSACSRPSHPTGPILRMCSLRRRTSDCTVCCGTPLAARIHDGGCGGSGGPDPLVGTLFEES